MPTEYLNYRVKCTPSHFCESKREFILLPFLKWKLLQSSIVLCHSLRENEIRPSDIPESYND